MRLVELVAYLDDYLRIRDVRDAPEALNGLQVENSGEVKRIGAAVDLCVATVRMAAEQEADLMLVHHGLFWGGLRALTGPQRRRVDGLIRHDIALYGAHLPLDIHPEVGNAPVLAHKLGIQVRGEFGDWEGQTCGVWGEVACSRDELAKRLVGALGHLPRVMAFGPDRARRVGVVTGAAGDMIPQAAAARLDTLITGEGQHWTFFEAEERGLNVYYGGHYATETFGVKALAEHLEHTFSLPWVFLDHPTGL